MRHVALCQECGITSSSRSDNCLLAARISIPMVRFFVFGQVEEYLQGIPNWLSQDIADFGLDVALDMTVQFTQNFTGNYFFEELRGLADGAGVDYQKILRIHMIGELTQVSVVEESNWSIWRSFMISVLVFACVTG